MDFSENQIQRYARHILLPEIGGEGQARLLDSSVLVVGAGGLGSPVLLYLAAAGVGRIGVIDPDEVDLSNLQRQILHTTDRIGTAKVESARAAIAAVNPDITLETHEARLDPDNIMGLIEQYDIVADGTDNFEARFLINDACYLGARPLVSAAILRFGGQLSTYKAHIRDDEGGHGPCYRCIFREPPPPGQIPSCAEAGVLGALCGVMGSLQATEVVKELLGVGDSLSGTLLMYEGLTTEFRRIGVKADPGCPLCGDEPTITDLSIHHGQAGAACVTG